MNSIRATEVFDDWFAGLKDKQAVWRVQVRIDRAEDGNFGDCEPVGEGVSEMRIHYGPGRNPHLNPTHEPQVERRADERSVIRRMGFSYGGRRYAFPPYMLPPVHRLNSGENWRLRSLPEGEEAIVLSHAGGKLDRGLACISCSAE